MAINISLVNSPDWITKSALLKNFNAKANSNNPKTIFTELSQLPLFGNEFNQLGNKANNPNGNANADEKPSIPTNGPLTFPLTALSKSNVPIIGPVHEKDTSDSVNAIKNIPNKPPLSLWLSILFTNDEGKVISNAPKNDAAKIIKMKKKTRLNQKFVDIAFNASIPNKLEIIKPKET